MNSVWILLSVLGCLALVSAVVLFVLAGATFETHLSSLLFNWSIILLVLGICAVIPRCAQVTEKLHDEFMAECKADGNSDFVCKNLYYRRRH